jgi:hypothetical protein
MVWIEVNEECRFVRLRILVQATIPNAARGAVAEAVARGNFGLLHGTLELDINDGELRYRDALLVADGTLGPDAVRMLLFGGLFTFDRYYPAFMRVAYGGASPAAAIADVETNMHREE